MNTYKTSWKLKKFQGRSLGCYSVTDISDVKNNPRNFSFREISVSAKALTNTKGAHMFQRKPRVMTNRADVVPRTLG